MEKENDLTGRIFGRLTVVGFSHSDKIRFWICKCSCGKQKIIRACHLKSGNTKSCGCLQRDGVKKLFTKHHLSGTTTYRTWDAMNQRCKNSKSLQYKDYGGRGIGICDKWLTFEGFYEDMGDRPKNKTLDRINVNGDYCKDNCRWATTKEQQNNKRNSRFIFFKGKNKTLSQWHDELGINVKTTARRIFRDKWSAERAFTSGK